MYRSDPLVALTLWLPSGCEDHLPGIEVVKQWVVEQLGISRDDLHRHGGHAGTAKSLAVELSCRFSGKTQREVGKYYGYSGDGGVSKQRKRLALRMASDKPLALRFDQLNRSLLKYIVQV